MFRFIFILLLQYSTITSVCSASFNQYDNSSTCDDCSCSAEIDIIVTFQKDLEAVRDDIEIVRKRTDEIEIARKRVDEIGTEISLIQKQLHAIRKSKPSSCIEAAAGSFKSGVYEIQLEKFAATPFDVWCNEDIDYGGWLVIQRRESDAVHFNRTWQDYKNGFGIPNGNFWLGLEKLHVLTSTCEHELYIEMKRFNGESYYAQSSEFVIGSELEGYSLKKLESFTGNAGDSLKYHVGKKFSTFDRDNDEANGKNCAEEYQSGWWFYDCYFCNLNGVYSRENEEGYGVEWIDIRFDESLKFAQMMIRPTENCLRRMSLRNY